jgi:exodeoxyribonuclease V beta subunit
MTEALNTLTMPLNGLRIIEASAGTGKTWTLAALYVRLVLGHGRSGGQESAALYPPQILVMTFTDAATSELRGRVRERLAQAARFFKEMDADGKADSTGADDFLRDLRAEFSAEQWPQCAHRLDMAAQWMDDAAIFTIHGWSSRMLKSHAFDSASLFRQSRVEDSDKLRLGAVRDYWRKWFYSLTLDQLGALKTVGANPDELLKNLKPLWSATENAPGVVLPVGKDPHTVIAEWDTWNQQFQALETNVRGLCTPELIALLDDVIAAKSLKGYLKVWPAKLAQCLQGDSIVLLNKKDKESAVTLLNRFSTTALVSKGWGKAGGHAIFGHIEALCLHLQSEPDVATELLNHAAANVALAYRGAKDELAQFDFSDLLQCLYYALQAKDGRLANAIRQQFPIALVDEFQDTDPWQYGALSKIYGESTSPDTGLVMIGDPKQAIYSFRGADLNTYLAARENAQSIYTLSGNFRSTKELVGAVNHVFEYAKDPFGEVLFDTVVACNANAKPLAVEGVAQTAMTVWHQVNAKSPRKDIFIRQMSDLFATQMVKLLNAKAASPGEMAVLVRDRTEARGIRKALAQRGVRSVYLSDRDSVFATLEASDLWRVMRAVANPRSTQGVRAALATRLWGLPFPQIEALIQDEQAWDALVDQFHGWRAVWQSQGFLPMLHRVLHDQSIPSRMLNAQALNSDGERRLSNVMHLGDLLQTASVGLQGEAALIRYLEQQLQNPKASGDAAQMRLESDADLVQVITIYKSKGLQYPLVFLPFVSAYKAEKKDSATDDSERLAEDVRMLYVALTRAEKALWVGLTEVKGDVDGTSPQPKSAVSKLLQRAVPGDLVQKLQTWSECTDIVVAAAPKPDANQFRPDVAVKEWKPALEPQRNMVSRWWTASFSALTRDLGAHAGGASMLGTDRDERIVDAQIDNNKVRTPLDVGNPTTGAVLAFNDFPAGSTYGTLLHDVLEWQFDRSWPIATASPSLAMNSEWEAMLDRKTRHLKLDEAQITLLGQWVRQLVQTALIVPGVSKGEKPLILSELHSGNAWAEMAFTLPVHRLGANRIDAFIGGHVLPGQKRRPLQPLQLEGMLVGFMDLVLEHEGKYFVLDYKSNRLPSYGLESLQEAILAHRYDVQYTLYVLALHRLLKSRLVAYDYDQHVGGAIYWFLRGVDQPGTGVFTDRPSKELIEALDHAFSQNVDALEVAA